MNAMAMASWKLPSLVSLAGPQFHAGGSKSCALLGKVRISRRTRNPGLGLTCSLEAQNDTSSRRLNEAELDSGFGDSQMEEQRNVEQRTRVEDKYVSRSFGAPRNLFSFAPMIIVPAIAENAGYSQASYYTSLGLFIISVPGVWSLVKRSTKSKVVKKTFVVPGPNVEAGKLPSQIAGEITSSLTRNNFKITDRGEVVTFEGFMEPSRGQAAFLSFCTGISLGCVALVLTITAPDVGSNWYFLTLLSPLAGFYYWTRASRKEEIKVKMVVSDDETSTDVILQGDDEQIDRLRRELELMEKGMVYVKGLFEK